MRSSTSRSIKRFAHQPKPAVLEVAQPAMDQLGRGRRRARREVVLLDQEHAQAAAGGIAGDAGAVDAAPDDGEVEIAHDSLQATASRGAPMPLKPVSGLTAAVLDFDPSP